VDHGDYPELSLIREVLQPHNSVENQRYVEDRLPGQGLQCCVADDVMSWCFVATLAHNEFGYLAGFKRHDWQIHLKRLLQLVLSFFNLLQAGKLEWFKSLGQVRSEYLCLSQVGPTTCPVAID